MLCGGSDLHSRISGIETGRTFISGISGMKTDRFTQDGLWIERNHRREGPPVTYAVTISGSTRLFIDSQALLDWVSDQLQILDDNALHEWLAVHDQEIKAAINTRLVFERYVRF